MGSKTAVCSADVNENAALLSDRQSSSSPISPGSYRFIENGSKRRLRDYIHNVIAILAIVLFGIITWMLLYYTGLWIPTPAPTNSSSDQATTEIPVGAEILGYISAIFYLFARIPQIIKNYREKSCEGLSLLFFLLSLMGNATYGLSIFCHSLQRRYLLTNLPWLMGSLGTMIEDVIIFQQFKIYTSNRRDLKRDVPASVTGP